MGNHFAQLQALKNGTATPKPEKKIKPIAHLSKKRQKLQPKLRKLAAKICNENNECEIKAVGCTFFMTETHHIIKRNETNLIDEKNILRVCRNCNSFVEKNDKWARENGFVVSKFKK